VKDKDTDAQMPENFSDEDGTVRPMEYDTAHVLKRDDIVVVGHSIHVPLRGKSASPLLGYAPESTPIEAL
jgi:hypothetical protein